MKLCPTCKNKYADDANFCPREECAGPTGPQRLVVAAEEPPARFVPVSRLGGGPSGEVWQANDAQSGAAVAYKLVAAESLPTVTAIERAQRELRQLQRANNRHIVKIVDFGKTAEGRLFVATELASGEPLDQLIARTGPIPLDRSKAITAQIGEALLEAQKVGVVHRDLAAKNILISGDDDVRIINFAIPRPLSEHVFGVPEYMSPEQSEGKLIDQRSNTYSLGALLYLMLTGQPPHLGETTQATIDAIQKGEITPPSIKRGSGLTAEVDRVVLKSLERNSSRRPLTMRQFLTDVSNLVVTEQSGPTASSATAAGGRDAGFARTMMFAGGANEVQKLVAQAVAARQAAGNGGAPEGAAPVAVPTPARAATPPPGKPPSGTPSPARLPPGTPPPALPVASSSDRRRGDGTPSPAGRPSHGAAVAATMVAMPAAAAAGGGSGTGADVPRGPAPLSDSGPAAVSPAASPSSAAAAAAPGPGGGGAVEGANNFRETLWFKKGDVDQMVAEARAKATAMADAKKAAEVAEAPTEDAKPLEDRYVDDGTVTTEDRKKFSLRSGGTSVGMAAARGGSVPGERMSENEMLEEIGGGKRFLIIGIVAAVVVALIAVIAISLKGKGKAKEGAAEISAPVAPAAAPLPPAAPVPTPPAPPPVAAPAEPPPPAPAAKAAPETDEKAEAQAKPAPARKRVVAKKKPAPPAKKKR